jgi:hypothetical protein
MYQLSAFVVLIVLSTCSQALMAQSLSGSGKAMNLLDAKNNGKIQVSIRGAYNPNKAEADVESAHYGECIDIRLRNNSDSTVNLVLPSGTMLISKDSSTQDMLVTKTIYYTLKPKEKISDRIYAMCGELHKNAPDVFIYYEVGELANPHLTRLASVIEMNGAQNKAGQYAVWAVTDKATMHDLGEDFATLEESQRLLNRASIKFDIFAGEHSKLSHVNNDQQKQPKEAKIVVEDTQKEVDQGYTVAKQLSYQTDDYVNRNALSLSNADRSMVSVLKRNERNVWIYAYASGALLLLAFAIYRSRKNTTSEDNKV